MKVSMKKDFAKLFGIQKTSNGFTLIELLVAMSITMIVVSLSGFGLVTIMSANNKGEADTQRRTNLNRALDFISDEVRTASIVTSTAPGWASSWTLGGGVPSAKLYVQIPLKEVDNMTAVGSITVNNHGFSNGNAVMFTGSGIMPTGLLKNQIYYVRDKTANTFNVSLAVDTAAIPLTTSSSGSLTVNQLLIYYIRTNTPTWLPPNTINRSAGPCSTTPNYAESNCPALVDSIAANGFTASVTSSRQAELTLIGKLSKNSTETYQVRTKAFVRANP